MLEGNILKTIIPSTNSKSQVTAIKLKPESLAITYKVYLSQRYYYASASIVLKSYSPVTPIEYHQLDQTKPSPSEPPSPVAFHLACLAIASLSHPIGDADAKRRHPLIYIRPTFHDMTDLLE